MEPISVALTAFTAIKAGVTAGKEISSLAGDLGKLWDACDAANAKHSKKRNSQFNMSANEEALSTFVAKQQAKDLEDELRELIIYTRGQSAWHELLQLRAEKALGGTPSSIGAYKATRRSIARLKTHMKEN